MAIESIDEKKCNGCEICRGLCPEDVLRMKNKKAVIAYVDDCIACIMCEIFCPTKAIKVNFKRNQDVPGAY